MSMGGVVIRECGGGKLSCLWIFEVTELPEKPETNLASQGCVLYSIIKDSRVFKFEIKSYRGKQCGGHLRRPVLDSHRVSCMNQCAGCHQLFPSALKWTLFRYRPALPPSARTRAAVGGTVPPPVDGLGFPIVVLTYILGLRVLYTKNKRSFAFLVLKRIFKKSL